MSVSPSFCTFIVNAHFEYPEVPHHEHATVLVQAYYNKISAKNQETEDLLVAKKMLSMNCMGKKLCTKLKPKMSVSPYVPTFIINAHFEYPK